MLEERTVGTRGVTRRTVLAAAGVGAAGVAGVAALGGVRLLHPQLPLDGTVLAAMVGQTFVDTQTGARLVLTAVDGLTGAAATADRFSLLLVAADDVPPAAIRTLRHASGDLSLYLGPVGPDGRTLEAVVDRSAGAA